jgi:hypothetical protein
MQTSEMLSFVNSENRDWWAVEGRTGDYVADAGLGRSLADETVRALRATSNPAAFARIAEAIVQRGEFDGVEIGFFTGLAERLTKVVETSR